MRPACEPRRLVRRLVRGRCASGAASCASAGRRGASGGKNRRVGRRKRIQPLGIPIHVIARGVKGNPIFRKAESKQHLLGLLEDVVERFSWSILDWVVMTNHVHVLFCPLVAMEKLIQGWKGHSARLLGKGSIWQSNYRDTLIRDAGHFANVARYIRRNPVKAKLGEGMYTLWEREGG